MNPVTVGLVTRDHPEAGCGVAGVAADAARADGPERGSYTRQVKECLAMVADLTGNPDHQAREREAILTLSALVGAISMARAVDDPDLSQQILTTAAAALKERILNQAGSRPGVNEPPPPNSADVRNPAS